MQHLLILNDPSYGTERSYNGLRMAHALAKHDPQGQVTVFLMADAVACAKAGQKTPEGFYNIERMIGRILSAGGWVLLCGTCMDGSAYYDPGIKIEGVDAGKPSIKRRSQFRVKHSRLAMLYRRFEVVGLSGFGRDADK